jgi:hypothetical protein
MSNQSLRQESVRAITSTELTYEGDWHALFDDASIDDGSFNGRLLAWLNIQESATYDNLPEAQAAFADTQGSPSWNELGTFTI